MEAAYNRTVESLRFRPLRISHSVAVMVMALAFHAEDPDRVGDALNIFLFPNLSPLVGSEAALLTQKWGATLGGGTLTSFAYTSLLIGKKKVSRHIRDVPPPGAVFTPPHSRCSSSWRIHLESF